TAIHSPAIVPCSSSRYVVPCCLVMIRNIAVTPRRETARAIPLRKTNVGAVVVRHPRPPRDEMKAPMLPGVTARATGGRPPERAETGRIELRRRAGLSARGAARAAAFPGSVESVEQPARAGTPQRFKR